MRQIASLHSVSEPLMRVWLEGKPSTDYVHDRHEELIGALKARDGAKVEALMRAHILRTLPGRSEEHTSELQSQSNLVCRLLLEKKKKTKISTKKQQERKHT